MSYAIEGFFERRFQLQVFIFGLTTARARKRHLFLPFSHIILDLPERIRPNSIGFYDFLQSENVSIGKFLRIRRHLVQIRFALFSLRVWVRIREVIN